MSTKSSWQQSSLHGGGFITGIVQHPHNPMTLFARSDVGGVFKSENRGQLWTPCNNGLTLYHQHDVRSIAISPHDPNLLFRGSGSVRGGEFFGFIHRSTDQGASWHEVTRAVDFYGNGELRQYGEVIAIDPHNPETVIAGGYSKGVWISHDFGLTWAYVGLKDERIVCVSFHPARSNVIFVGTVGSFDTDPVFVAQQYDYVRPNPSRLYRSSDLGATWDVLHEGSEFAELAFDPNNPDLIHAACRDAGIMRSADGGRTWSAYTPQVSKYGIGTITIDPHSPRTLYATAETFPNFDPDVPPIGVYRSDDAGETWCLIHWHTMSDLCNYPSYIELPYAGWAVSKIRVDHDERNRLYLSNWYGVSVSTDGGLTWDAHNFAGIENTCLEHVTAHPTQTNHVYLVGADHNPMASYDAGRSFNALPRPSVSVSQPDSTAFVVSRHSTDMILYGIKGSGVGAIVKAKGDGSDPRVVWQGEGTPDVDPERLKFQSRAAAVSVQGLIEDPFMPGVFYAYIDGLLRCGAGMLRSTDWGDTWQRLANPFPPHIARVPYQRQWIENELLPVVIAQTKNVCGTNQLLCPDPFQPGVLYVGEWTEGLFRTTDGGVSWNTIRMGLPFGRDRTSVINVIRADPVREGVLYVGFIREGVWRSMDRGESWEKLFPHDDTPFNATTLAVGNTVIAVACEPLYHAPYRSQVWISRDGGETWEEHSAPEFGALRWKSLALSANERTLYAGTCGSGAFTLHLNQP